MYVKFFSRYSDGRMPSEDFKKLCTLCDFDPDLVLEVASMSGYSFDKNYYCDLETLVSVEKSKYSFK